MWYRLPACVNHWPEALTLNHIFGARHAVPLPSYYLFLPFLGRRRGLLFAHGAGLAAGAAFFWFAARFQFIAAFFTGKNGH